MAPPLSAWLRRGTDLLAPLGVVIMIGAEAWRRSLSRPLPGQPRWYFIAGAALILAHLILRWDDVAGRLGRRQMRYGSHMAVTVLSVIAILAGLNYVVVRRGTKWDLTKGQRHSLSEATRKVLGSLQQDVTLTYFDRPANMEEARARLEQYREASPRVKLSYVDPVADPAPARQHQITGPTVLIQVGDKSEKVFTISEQEITNGIIKAQRGTRKTVCFAQGEGERDIDDTSRRGLSTAKDALAHFQYETRKVVLARQPLTPGECTVVVVAGPEKDLFPQAAESLRHFVKGGGKALVMLEPPLSGSTPTPNVLGLLEEWNLEAGQDVVVDASGQSLGVGPFTPLVTNYPWHEITKDMRQVATVFHTVRSVQARTGTPQEGVVAQNLAETIDRAWAETDLGFQPPVQFDEGKDRRGPVSLAAVATLSGAALSAPGATPSPSPAASPAIGLDAPIIASPVAPPPLPSPEDSPSPEATPVAGGAPSPEGSPAAASPAPAPSPSPEPKREARVAVFGDVDFASNELLRQPVGNVDLLVNTVAWLAEDADLISVRTPEAEDQRLFLTNQQQGNIGLISQILLPGALLAMGVVSWWKRRA